MRKLTDRTLTEDIFCFRMHGKKRQPEPLLITAQRIYLYVGCFISETKPPVTDKKPLFTSPLASKVPFQVPDKLPPHHHLVLRLQVHSHMQEQLHQLCMSLPMFSSILRLTIRKSRRARSSFRQVFLRSQRTSARIRCLPVLPLP